MPVPRHAPASPAATVVTARSSCPRAQPVNTTPTPKSAGTADPRARGAHAWFALPFGTPARRLTGVLSSVAGCNLLRDRARASGPQHDELSPAGIDVLNVSRRRTRPERSTRSGRACLIGSGDDAQLFERGVAHAFDVHAGLQSFAQELDV